MGQLGDFGLPGWVSPVASALLPGSGQILRGRDRGAVYLAAEVFFLVRFWSLRSEASRERDQYHDLAFDVARAQFRPAKRDTVFEYFEIMEKYQDSGPFDLDPGPALIPPLDDVTFNGRLWRLARETFLPDPDAAVDTAAAEYRRALDFYAGRAIGPNFQWSWRNAGLEQDLFRQSIRRSDRAFRFATQYLGLLLANHMASAIDAFVSHRLGSGHRAELRSAVFSGRSTHHGAGVEASVVLKVSF